MDEKAAWRLLEEVWRAPVPTGAVELNPAYLALVRYVEDLEENRSGTDKSQVERRIAAYRRHHASARLVR